MINKNQNHKLFNLEGGWDGIANLPGVVCIYSELTLTFVGALLLSILLLSKMEMSFLE